MIMPLATDASFQRRRRRPCHERLLCFVQSTPFILSATYGFALLAGTCDSFSIHQYSNNAKPTTRLSMVSTLGSTGLSRYFQAILSRTRDRQRFVTGKYPVIVTIQDDPTQKWLKRDGATSLVLVNETTIDKSLASYDRFQWLDDIERHELHERYASLSVELLAEIHISKPGYLQVLSRNGAGASADLVREYGSMTRWNRWENSTLYKELFVDELIQRTPQHPNRQKIHDRLWVTGFSLAGRKGFVQSVNVHSGHIESVNARSEGMTLWPNEVTSVPKQLITRPPHHGQVLSENNHNDIGESNEDDALLVSDGFLVPGKDRGGIYVIKNPGNPYSEWTVSLTDREGERWFYHRAVWVDLTGDGRKSILTARAKLQKVTGKDNGDDVPTNRRGITGRFGRASSSKEDRRPKNGQLVWLEMPKPHHHDEATGTALEEDGTVFDPFSSRHLPWKEHVLARGPDVMFSVADMDPTDNTIEVIASQFFDKKVTLHSIMRGPKPRITFSRVIDDRCGAAFGGILSDLRENHSGQGDIEEAIVIDSGSTVESLRPGDSFSHLLVTSHECTYSESPTGAIGETLNPHHSHHRGHHPTAQVGQAVSFDGGSLFSYKVPVGRDAWKTAPWIRTTIASGFKVNGQLWNVINPGAPGFVYSFHAKLDDRGGGKRPLIAVAGDCAESAYIFRPEKLHSMKGIALDPESQYKLMCEIKCGATVGSIAVGYENLCSVDQESGYAKVYVPCFEKDRILVFALGSGEDDDQVDELPNGQGNYHDKPPLPGIKSRLI